MEELLKISGDKYRIASENATEILTASKTLTANDRDKTFYIATDALVVTLPLASTVTGIKYRFVNSGADGNNIITISPNQNDAIHGTITLAASVVELSGLDDKDLINTKLTATTGNSVLIESNGVDWYVLNATGIWASEV